MRRKCVTGPICSGVFIQRARRSQPPPTTWYSPQRANCCVCARWSRATSTLWSRAHRRPRARPTSCACTWRARRQQDESANGAARRVTNRRRNEEGSSSIHPGRASLAVFLVLGRLGFRAAIVAVLVEVHVAVVLPHVDLELARSAAALPLVVRRLQVQPPAARVGTKATQAARRGEAHIEITTKKSA